MPVLAGLEVGELHQVTTQGLAENLVETRLVEVGAGWWWNNVKCDLKNAGFHGSLGGVRETHAPT